MIFSLWLSSWIERQFLTWQHDREIDINKFFFFYSSETILPFLGFLIFTETAVVAPASTFCELQSKLQWKLAVNDWSYRRHFVKIDRKVRSWHQVNLLVRSYTSGSFSSQPLVLLLLFLFSFSTSLVTCNLQFVVAFRESNLNRADDSIFFYLTATFSTFPTKKHNKKFSRVLWRKLTSFLINCLTKSTHLLFVLFAYKLWFVMF